MTKLIIYINIEIIIKHFLTNDIIDFVGKLINQTNIYAIMFITALITIAKS